MAHLGLIPLDGYGPSTSALIMFECYRWWQFGEQLDARTDKDLAL